MHCSPPLLPNRKRRTLVLDAEAAADGQSRRLIRPLLACLATKSGAENGTPVNLYGGEFAFQRRGPEGPIWILGRFENRPGSVLASFRRSAIPPENLKALGGQKGSRGIATTPAVSLTRDLT